MKLNRFVALAAIALLVVGALGAVGARAFAQGPGPSQPKIQATEAPKEQEPASGPDTDAIQSEAADAAGQEDSGPDDQSPAYQGSVMVDQAATEGLSEADESTALASQAKISVEDAQAAALAANPGASVVQAELDNENGALVYSVELSNGADVKVDAGNGTILHTDTGADIGE